MHETYCRPLQNSIITIDCLSEVLETILEGDGNGSDDNDEDLCVDGSTIFAYRADLYKLLLLFATFCSSALLLLIVV